MALAPVPGPPLRHAAAFPPVDDALAKLRQAAQSAIDSVTMSMLGGSRSHADQVQLIEIERDD